MSDAEALTLLDDLRSQIESQEYALYYVGMMDNKEGVLIALDRAIAALASQQPPYSERVASW